MRHTRRISIRSLSPVSFHFRNFFLFKTFELNRLILILFVSFLLFVHSDWDRNVELAQLIQQKLDAYKAGKFENYARNSHGADVKFVVLHFQTSRPWVKGQKKRVHN